MGAKKKKQPTKTGSNDEEDEEDKEDPLLANPNRTMGKKLNIADLDAPRELSRREKYVHDRYSRYGCSCSI